MACVVIHLVSVVFWIPHVGRVFKQQRKNRTTERHAFEILESVTLDISYLAYFGYLDRKNEYFHVCQMNQNLI